MEISPKLSETFQEVSKLFNLYKMILFPQRDEEPVDPLPAKLKRTVVARLRSDLIVCPVTAVFVFGIHCSTVFTALQPDINHIMWALVSAIGFLLHYIMPQLRKQLPWLCFSNPIFKTHEHNQFEVSSSIYFECLLN
jgi:hypothetical protein